MLISDSELFSSFELIMWLPSTSSDSVWKTANTFYEGKVTFNKGKITVTGDFDKNNFILTKDKDGNNICKFNFSILKELPEGINGLTTPIEIVGISDAGIIETDFIVDDNTYIAIFSQIL